MHAHACIIMSPVVSLERSRAKTAESAVAALGAGECTVGPGKAVMIDGTANHGGARAEKMPVGGGG